MRNNGPRIDQDVPQVPQGFKKSHRQDGKADQSEAKGRKTRKGVCMIHKFNLALEKSYFRRLEALARSENMTITALVLKFIRIGCFVLEIQMDPNKKLIIRDGSTEKEIVIL
jgi:hypothetical protein